MKNKR